MIEISKQFYSTASYLLAANCEFFFNSVSKYMSMRC